MDVKKSLDTYALVEIVRNNPKFEKYVSQEIILNNLTLAEFYGVLLREHGEKTADYWFKKLERFSFQVPKEILIEAVKFKHKYRKQKISFFDAVGYIFSLKHGLKFVTGDKEFEKLPNVEFIKK